MTGRGSVKRRGDVWRARFRNDDGREVQRSFPKKAHADAWLKGQLSALHRGDWVDPAAGGVPFAAYAADWLTQQHVRPTTARLNEMRVRLYLNPVVGAVPLRAVRRSHVVEVVTRMVGQGLSPLVIRYAVVTLRAVLAAAVADRLITTNVALDRTIALPKPEREAMVPLTAGEIAAIAAAIDPRLRALVVLGAATGLRSGELRGLTADRVSPPVHLGAVDVLPRQGVVRVDRQLVVGRVLAAPKTTSSVRDVSVGATTMATLRDHVGAYGLGSPHGFVFTTSAGSPVDASQLSVAWSRAVRAAGVRSDVTVHDLRHHHASELLSQGLNIAAVARRLGHSSPTVTLATYAHVMPDDDARALVISEAIAERLA